MKKQMPTSAIGPENIVKPMLLGAVFGLVAIILVLMLVYFHLLLR